METEITTKKKIDISKQEFMAYEKCRESGLTNMFNVANVEIITGLNRNKIIAIMENYEQLNEEYL